MKTILALIAVMFMASLGHGQTNQLEEVGPGALEQVWAIAVQHQDVEKIDRIQAAEYVFTDPAGQVWTKTRGLDAIKAGDLAIDAFELSELKVRLYDNTAVVTLRIVWHGQFRGTDISGPQRMTGMFVKRDGRWQCVASQATRIPPQ